MAQTARVHPDLTIELPQAGADAIRRHGERGFPLEVCGALGGEVRDGRWRVARSLEATNAWAELGLAPEDPAGTERRFAIEPKWILAVERELRNDDLEIVGFYHSHPNHPARPSAADRRYLWPRVVQMICSVYEGQADSLTAWYQGDEAGPFDEVAVEIV